MSSLLWHLSFHLIPRGSEDRIEIDAGSVRTIGNAELTPCWRGRETYDFAAMLDGTISRSGGGSPLVERWGCEETISAEVWRLPQGISVYVRIHIVNSAADAVERLMLAIRGGGLAIVFNDLRVIEPQAAAIMAEIQNISAARFLASPTQFLQDLSGFA